jgi:hypothetical protein
MAIQARRIPTILAQTHVCKLKYSDFISLNPGVTNIVSNRYRASSVRDPDATGLGAAPRGFAQLSALYEDYTVLGSRIRVTFVSTNSASTGEAWVGIFLDEQNIAHSQDTEGVFSRRALSRAFMPPFGSGKSSAVVTARMNTKRWFRTNPMTDVDCLAAVTTDPVKQVFYHVWAGGTTASVDPSTISATVEIEYIVAFRSRRAANNP